MMVNVLKLLFLCLLLLGPISSHAGEKRWYSANQVKQGQGIFQDKCARCHGVNAEGDPDWRELDEDSQYPPPPLDGNAFSWLHTLVDLRQQIMQGSRIKEGDMPSFKNKLNAQNIDAVIAYFQSKWSDDTYRIWQARQMSVASRSHMQESTQQHLHHKSSHWLKRHLSAARIEPGEPMKTPVEGISEVKVNGSYMYLSEDGRYAFTGDMIDLIDGSNMTELSQARDTKRLIQAYSLSDMLVYPAHGKEHSYLTIFTDTSCVYCRKMHQEVPELVARGITVRYIPYPRRGLNGKGYSELTSIWCSKDPRQALLDYIEERQMPASAGKCEKMNAVAAGYLLGNSVGISGTPLLVLENGERLRGYNTAAEVLEEMNIN